MRSEQLYIWQIVSYLKSSQILGNLTVLNFDQHHIAAVDKDSFADSLAAGRLEKLHLTNGRLGDFPVEAFTVLRKLKTLDLHGNRIGALKRNQFKNMRDVEVLDLSHNQLAKLDSSHIADLTKLSWCNVSHNALAELTRGTFARNSVLRVLNMAHNGIKRLDSNSFRGMRFMRYVTGIKSKSKHTKYVRTLTTSRDINSLSH